jgi:hypothetical protein
VLFFFKYYQRFKVDSYRLDGIGLLAVMTEECFLLGCNVLYSGGGSQTFGGMYGLHLDSWKREPSK